MGPQLSGKYVNDSSSCFVPACKVFLVDKNLEQKLNENLNVDPIVYFISEMIWSHTLD